MGRSADRCRGGWVGGVGGGGGGLHRSFRSQLDIRRKNKPVFRGLHVAPAKAFGVTDRHTSAYVFCFAGATLNQPMQHIHEYREPLSTLAVSAP